MIRTTEMFTLCNLSFLSELDQCHPNPCAHGGLCREVVGGTGFACQCITGYKGARCDGKLKQRKPNGVHCNVGKYSFMKKKSSPVL